jgi:hypothetical protein
LINVTPALSTLSLKVSISIVKTESAAVVNRFEFAVEESIVPNCVSPQQNKLKQVNPQKEQTNKQIKQTEINKQNKKRNMEKKRNKKQEKRKKRKKTRHEHCLTHINDLF